MMEKLDNLVEEEEDKKPLNTRERRQEEKIAILEAAHEELLKQLAEKEEENQESVIDDLTGLMRRGPFLDEVENYLNDIEKGGSKAGVKEVSLIMFDIDHFKSVNDTYGHDIGDLVLERVAGVIRDSVRKYDPTCRWGGEEMALAMIDANEEQAAVKAEKLILHKIRKLDFSDIHPKLKDLHITVSAGVASSKDYPTIETLSKAADKALYASKHSGRDCVTSASELSSEK